MLAGDSKWRASRLNSLAYQLAEGRSKSFSKTISRPQTWYRTIFMGSLENSFRTDLERSQTIGASGSTARLIELPAASNKDPDIFDRAPSSLNDQRAAWVEAQFEMIRQGCKRNAGVALPEFVEYIIRNPITARRFLAKQSANFLKTIRTQADEPAVRHIAKYFAHIAAAGLLAQKLGIVPWSRAIVLDACRRCYDRAIKVLPTEENVLRRALAQLHNEINSGNLPKYRGTPLPETRLRDAGGYWESGREHRKYTIRADRFIGWVGSNAGLKLLQRFEKAGLLVAAKKRNISIKSRVIDFETQITWPDCKRVRSIQLILDYRAMKAAIRAHS